jgi:EAL domain-containing protein (putative c-di-GMP-specific phosphodiesterase class I)
VERLDTRGDESALAQAIVKLGHTLRLKTVAEGIEETGQLDALRAIDCHLGQGFYFARPLDPASVDVLLDADSHGTLDADRQGTLDADPREALDAPHAPA